MSSELKTRIAEDVRAAMRARARDRLGTLRLISAALKQREVDERIELDDERVIEVLTRMVKQRQDSITQYRQAAREDLAAREEAELAIIGEYLPAPLDDAALATLLAEAIGATGAGSARDMGKVMAWLRPRVQGRTDMAALSTRVKAALASL